MEIKKIEEDTFRRELVLVLIYGINMVANHHARLLILSEHHPELIASTPVTCCLLSGLMSLVDYEDSFNCCSLIKYRRWKMLVFKSVQVESF